MMETTHPLVKANSASPIWRRASRQATELFTASFLCALLTCACLASPASLPQFTQPGLVLATAIQDDGKLIIGGYFSLVNGVSRHNIARLNRDGSLDGSWNPSANNA